VSNAAVASWSLLTAGDCRSCSTRVEKKVLRDLKRHLGNLLAGRADAAGGASNLHEVSPLSRAAIERQMAFAHVQELAYETLTSPVGADAEP